ncbi:MAG TPA: type VI secretion system-associated protein TagO [Candidatus Sulfotelmatobacter sp.]
MLDTCFEMARTADAICSDPKNGAAERFDCRKKARTAQLECLDHVLPGGSAGSVPPETPPRTVSPEMPTVAAPEVPARSASPERPIGTVAKGEPASSLKTPPGIVPPETPIALSSTVRAAVRDTTERLEICFQEARAADVACIDPANDTVKRVACFQSARAAQVECLENISHEPPAGSAQNKPADTAWVVSETTSPVDYSPLITAVIHPTSGVKDAPNTLAVGCRGSRTELLLRTEGAWRASRAGEVQIDHQINDQPFVRLQWTVSADGRTASYKDDAVGLLRSLPEGARLKISVFVRQEGPGQEATFQLTGLDGVRKKIGLACKWPPTADKMSLGETMNQLGVAVGKHLRITRRGRMFVLVSKHHKHPYRN